MRTAPGFSRREFLRAVLIGGCALTACSVPTSGLPTSISTRGDETMEAIKTSSATLPEAMTRGVEKNGWRIIGPGGGGALYVPTIHPNNPDIALVSCDMTGAYRTENGGQTWTEINLKARPFAFAFDPSHPATVYAGATGLYRSDDGGYAWRLIFPRPGQVERETFLGDHAEHEYVSRDNWPGGSVQAICVDPQNSRRIFLGIRSPALRLFSSSDAGENWVEIGQVEGTQFRKTCLVATPTGQQWFILTDQRLVCFDLQSAGLKDAAMPAPEVLSGRIARHAQTSTLTSHIQVNPIVWGRKCCLSA